MTETQAIDVWVNTILQGAFAQQKVPLLTLKRFISASAAPNKPGAESMSGILAGTLFLLNAKIDTCNRLAHFLGQISHETGQYQWLQELGGPGYFKRYDNRTDLGNIHPGDGAKYHGRGLIQLTGAANYAKYGALLGLPLFDQPEMVAKFPAALMTAIKYWELNALNNYADKDDCGKITKKINGGLNGIDDRKRLTNQVKATIVKEYSLANLVKGD